MDGLDGIRREAVSCGYNVGLFKEYCYNDCERY